MPLLIKSNSSNMLFLTFMLIGILMTISSNHWLGCWMRIAINFISFLPIMMNSMSVYTSESMIKYFIVQSMESGLLFISVMFMFMYNVNYFTTNRYLIVTN